MVSSAGRYNIRNRTSVTRMVVSVCRTQPRVLLLSLIIFGIIVWSNLGTNDGDKIVFIQTQSNNDGITSRSKNNKPNGVFVIKAARVEDVGKTLCSLTHFFNAKHQYPVRIFVDTTTNTNPDLIQSFNGGADVQVIPDVHQTWTKLPDTLTETEKEQVLKLCKNMDNPQSARCTYVDINLGYVYMNYWNYAKMPYEEPLKQFEYIISFDADAFLTQPMYIDPFRVLQDNDLVGFFDIEAFQGGHVAMGVQETIEKHFNLSERRDRFLDYNVQFFDSNGIWNDPSFQDEGRKPSVWTHFWGCRRDFFNDPRYLSLARSMTVNTYLYRVDEQPVIGTAWALLLDNRGSRVWYLPRHGINLGVFHHGWVDNREILRPPADEDGKFVYRVNPLHTWNRDFHDHPNQGQAMGWEEYLLATGQERICWNTTTK